MSIRDPITALQSQLTTSTDQSTPKLPPELERKIFGLALDFDDPVANRRLILVAKRICVWLRPELYRVFYQCPPDRGYLNFRNCPEGVNEAEICQYARHMLLDFTIPADEATKLLDMCPNLEDLTS